MVLSVFSTDHSISQTSPLKSVTHRGVIQYWYDHMPCYIWQHHSMVSFQNKTKTKKKHGKDVGNNLYSFSILTPKLYFSVFLI